jgi:hypothetical protein
MTHHDKGHQTGTSQQSGSTTRPMWGQHAQKYRSDWTGRFPNKDWGQHEHAFRYGWESSFSDSFKGRDFNSVTGDMEREWPNRYNYWPDFSGNKVEGAWNDFKDTVREGWDAARREFNKAF